MKALRWSLGILGAVVLLIALALFIVTHVINPDEYRGELERLVARDTGRPLQIEGHLRLEWYPWLELRIGAARLGNLAPIHGADLVRWRSARLPVRLLPLLLHQRIEIGTIRIDGAHIRLWRTAAGTGNWQPLLAGAPGGTSGAPPSLGGLVLRDATLQYSASSGVIRLTHWQLRLGAWQPGRPFALATRFRLHAPKLPVKGIAIAFRARHLNVRTAPLALSAPHWDLTAANATLSGSVQFADPNARPRGTGELTLQVPSVRALIAQLGLKMRLPQDPGVLGLLSLTGRWMLQGSTMRIDPLSARLDQTTLSGWLAHSGGATARWTFDLNADHIDFSDYLPPARRHPKALKLPLTLLRKLHARGVLTVQRARLGTATLRDARLQVQ
ncbi:MAG: AsmA family protein [Steroidobacteraceae bacterium]